ncbi:hypothetical protein E2320_008073 [Naja naja]|nr:hypothetical protein E2320_008073 [Naja naja]
MKGTVTGAELPVKDAELQKAAGCGQSFAFYDSVSFTGSSAPATIPFMSTQEEGADVAATSYNEGRALALLCSMASYSCVTTTRDT